MLAPNTLDADVVFHLGQLVPQFTQLLQCAHCPLTPQAYSCPIDIYWPGLPFQHTSLQRVQDTWLIRQFAYST